jgi:hypothetical protein
MEEVREVTKVDRIGKLTTPLCAATLSLSELRLVGFTIQWSRQPVVACASPSESIPQIHRHRV